MAVVRPTNPGSAAPRPLPYPLRVVLDLLFPSRCQGCGSFGPDLLCAACREVMHPIFPPFCSRCGLPFDLLARGGGLCARCRLRSRFPYRWSRSAARYEGPLRQAILSFKFERRRVLAGVLAELMMEAVDRWQQAGLPDSDPAGWQVLCPVPLHPDRLRARTFNQCELLCRELGGRLGLPVASLLVRTRATGSQVELAEQERRANVRGAFALAPGAAVAGRRIVLVDDLWTTGSTLVECARTLREAAAVYLFSLARPARG